jgi:hypothetical protein
MELPDLFTPCSYVDLIKSFAYAWEKVFNTAPKKEAICVLMCQWALETGRGKSCHCWNHGNYKHVSNDGCDWTYFRCNEIINGKEVWFDPVNEADKPSCCFKAFKTLGAGSINYIASLYKRFGFAWDAVSAGDPKLFGHRLKVQHYYTADEDQYTHTLVQLFTEFMKLDMTDYLQLFTADETEDVQMVVAASLKGMGDAAIDEARSDDETA